MDNLASDDTILLLDRMRDFSTRQLHLEVSWVKCDVTSCDF